MIDPQKAAQIALEVERITYASFTTNQFGVTVGVAADKISGTEFDVRLAGMVWNVSDDAGRYYRSLFLRRALRKACRAQEEPS